MTNWIELAIYVATSILITVLVFIIILLSMKNRQLLMKAVQSEMDRMMTMAELEKLVNDKENKSVEQTDGFLKFVSDSRDWAFEYIEDVQQALLVYDVALNTDDAAIINEAYKKLISFLPDDDVVK